MPITLTIDLEDNQELVLPHEVSGTATWDGTNQITVVTWCVDEGEVHDESPTAPVDQHEFDFVINILDCNEKLESHGLVVIAWDAVGNSERVTRTFTIETEGGGDNGEG